MPQDATIYQTASAAMAAFSNRPFYLKHTIDDNLVTESYVEFVVTETMVSNNSGMIAGTYKLDIGNSEEVLTENMNAVKTAFDYSNHPERCSGKINSYFYCSVSGLYARVEHDWVEVGTSYYGDEIKCFGNVNRTQCNWRSGNNADTIVPYVNTTVPGI